MYWMNNCTGDFHFFVHQSIHLWAQTPLPHPHHHQHTHNIAFCFTLGVTVWTSNFNKMSTNFDQKAQFNLQQIHWTQLVKTFNIILWHFAMLSGYQNWLAYTYLNNWKGINGLNASSSACHILHFLWSRLATFQVSYKARIFSATFSPL